MLLAVLTKQAAAKSQNLMNESIGAEAQGNLEEASVAHEVAHGLSALASTVSSARSIISSSLTEVTEDDWTDLREHLDAIDRELQAQIFKALTALAHQFPSFAMGLQRPEVRPVKLHEVLAAMLDLYESKACQRGIRFEINNTSFEEFPEIAVEVNSLRRVFHNVLTNAIKYSYSGHRSSKFVRIWGRRHDAHGKWWAMFVQNFGLGFSADERAKLFEPSYRGEAARNERVFGSGLGLPDVRSCMSLHGGKVDIVSRPVEGGAYVTTLSLVFPRETNIVRALAR